MIPINSTDRTPRAKPAPGKKQGAILKTNNARDDRIATAWTYRFPWQDGKRCLIPAWLFIEPNWETMSNVWWQFRRNDGRPWALAGLWNEWTDPKTGEVVPNYTMITVNANDHPLMSRMHRPEVDPGTEEPLPLAQQDKRSVVSIEAANMEQWLTGSQDEARALLKPPALELIEAGPA